MYINRWLCFDYDYNLVIIKRWITYMFFLNLLLKTALTSRLNKQIPKFVNIISMHWGFTLYNSLRIHRVNSQVAQFVWFKLYARIFGISAAYLKRDLHHLGRFPFVRTGRPDNCRTSQLANEIGFLQGFLLKKLCPSCILVKGLLHKPSVRI